MKKILLLIAFAITSQNVFSSALVENADAELLLTPKEAKECQSISEQLDMVELILEENIQPKILVLGAYPSQSEQFNFSEYDNPAVFYIDRLLCDNQYNLTSPFFIKADLTDMNFLSEMVGKFENHFDLITVDWAVTTHLEWNAEHINAFISLLKSGGKFVFDYSEGMPRYLEHNDTPSTMTENDLQDISFTLKKRPVYKQKQKPNSTINSDTPSSNDYKAMKNAKPLDPAVDIRIDDIYLSYLNHFMDYHGIRGINVALKMNMFPYWKVDEINASDLSAILLDQYKRFRKTYIEITKHS